MDRLASFGRSGLVGRAVSRSSSAAQFPTVAIGLAITLAMSTTATGWADSPHVRFDVGPAVGCRDMTTDAFLAASPNERLVEARFLVSSLISDGQESDLIQYLYFFESPHQTIQIVDFLPQTTMASEIAGNVGIEKKEEKLHHLGITLNGQYDLLRASAGGETDSKKNSSVKYELLPPMELVAASGTVQRGSGAYFKLKPSSQISLEGAKEFVLVLKVPRVWRGGYIHLRCTAAGHRRRLVSQLDERRVCGVGEFVIGMHLDGDEGAKAAADRLARAEADIRRLATEQREELKRKAYPSFMHQVGGFLDVVPPKIPDSWLQQLVFGSSGSAAASLARRLPPDLCSAAESYLSAKSQLDSLSGRHRQLAQANVP